MIEAYGTFFAASGSKVYYTDGQGNPNYWPATNYINFHANVTGLAVIPIGIVVFTNMRTYIITGTNASTFTEYPISSTQGCINAKSIVEYNNTIMFLSANGICTISGTVVEVVSKFKLGQQTYNSINAVLYNEVYYVQLADKSLVILDTRYGVTFYDYDFGTNWLVVANNVLYGQLPAGGLYEFFAGADTPYEYSTGNLTDGRSSELKQYNDIYLYVEGTHTLKTYINDNLVATKSITGNGTPSQVTVPQDLQRGSYIRFDLTGTGTVKEIEYKVVPRDNGR